MKIGIMGRKSLICSKFKPFLLCVKVLRFSTLVFIMWGAACFTNLETRLRVFRKTIYIFRAKRQQQKRLQKIVLRSWNWISNLICNRELDFTRPFVECKKLTFG